MKFDVAHRIAKEGIAFTKMHCANFKNHTVSS